MSRLGGPKNRRRMVSVFGVRQRGGREGDAAHKIVAPVLEQQNAVLFGTDEMARALIGAFVERHVEEGGDAQPQRFRRRDC